MIFGMNFQENALKFVDNITESWFNSSCVAGGVARCSTYLFPLRSPGSYPPFRGFGLYRAWDAAEPPMLLADGSFPRAPHAQIGLAYTQLLDPLSGERYPWTDAN